MASSTRVMLVSQADPRAPRRAWTDKGAVLPFAGVVVPAAGSDGAIHGRRERCDTKPASCLIAAIEDIVDLREQRHVLGDLKAGIEVEHREATGCSLFRERSPPPRQSLFAQRVLADVKTN